MSFSIASFAPAVHESGMFINRWRGCCAVTYLLFAVLARGLGAEAPSRVTINADLALVIDGQKVFPIGFTLPPPLGGKTPEGRDAFAEF